MIQSKHHTKYRRTLYASYIGYITQAIVNNLIPLLFVTLQHEFTISLKQIGFLVTFNFCIQIIVDFISAKYVDRIGYKTAIIAAHIFAGVGLVGLGILPYIVPNAYVGILIAVVCYAIGGGIIEVLISPIVEALPTEEKSTAMSLLHSFYCWGHVSVVLLSTLYFVTVGTLHWRFLPIIWSIVPFFNVLLFMGSPVKAPVEAEHMLSLKNLMSMKLFWLFIVLMICSGASEQAMSQWVSFFAESGLKVSKTTGDLLGPCMFAVLMGISRTIYGKWGEKINLNRYILLSTILCIFSYLLAVLSPIPIVSLIGCALCGLAVGIMWPGTFSLASKHCPKGGTAMFAFLALAGDVGCGGGPSVVGIVSDRFGNRLQAGLLAATVFPILLFIGILVLRKWRKQEVEENCNLV